MGRALRGRAREDRRPPYAGDFEDREDFDITVGERRRSLDAHRDLLVDLTGVEPDGELTLQDLETIRARLEGHIERTSRPATEPTEGAGDEDRDRSGGWIIRVLEWVRAAVERAERERSDEGTKDGEETHYSEERVRHLAAAFRAAADARRREIAGSNDAPAGQAAAD